MSITLPNASTATTNSNATITAETAAAQAVFVANATVLINDAIQNGLFRVEPFMINLVTSDYITTYFQALGYTVVFPIFPPGPFDFCFVPAGFPEVIPSGWTNWGCACGSNCTPRIRISWST